jgi:rubrerythrin
MAQAYCLKCREMVEVQEPKIVAYSNGAIAITGVCPVSGTRLSRIASWQDDPIIALQIAIQREKQAHEFYLDAAENTTDSMGSRMFKWLANQEDCHRVALEKQLKSRLDKGTWLEWREEIEPVLSAEFPEISEAFGAYSPSTGDIQALEMGIEAEKKAIEFYRNNRDYADDPEAQKMFDWFAEHEEGHRRLMEEELKWIQNGRKFFQLPRFMTR